MSEIITDTVLCTSCGPNTYMVHYENITVANCSQESIALEDNFLTPMLCVLLVTIFYVEIYCHLIVKNCSREQKRLYNTLNVFPTACRSLYLLALLISSHTREQQLCNHETLVLAVMVNLTMFFNIDLVVHTAIFHHDVFWVLVPIEVTKGRDMKRTFDVLEMPFM